MFSLGLVILITLACLESSFRICIGNIIVPFRLIYHRQFIGEWEFLSIIVCSVNRPGEVLYMQIQIYDYQNLKKKLNLLLENHNSQL